MKKYNLGLEGADMARVPTNLLRKMLVLDMVEKQLNQHRRELVKRLDESDVVLIDQSQRNMDVLVKYRWNGYWHEVTFMREMLDAEVYGRIEHLLGGSE
jgi:hypothetical protein